MIDKKTAAKCHGIMAESLRDIKDGTYRARAAVDQFKYLYIGATGTNTKEQWRDYYNDVAAEEEGDGTFADAHGEAAVSFEMMIEENLHRVVDAACTASGIPDPREVGGPESRAAAWIKDYKAPPNGQEIVKAEMAKAKSKYIEERRDLESYKYPGEGPEQNIAYAVARAKQALDIADHNLILIDESAAYMELDLAKANYKGIIDAAMGLLDEHCGAIEGGFDIANEVACDIEAFAAKHGGVEVES